MLRQLGQQGRAVGHLVAELEVERARLAEPARPAPVDLDQLRPMIEARVREMRAAFEGSPDDCRATFRALLGDRKMRVFPDEERRFRVEGCWRWH